MTIDWENKQIILSKGEYMIIGNNPLKRVKCEHELIEKDSKNGFSDFIEGRPNEPKKPFIVKSCYG